jgi:hypothetical protein
MQVIAAPVSNNHPLEYPEPNFRLMIGLGVDFDFKSFIFTILSVISLEHVIFISSLILLILGLFSIRIVANHYEAIPIQPLIQYLGNVLIHHHTANRNPTQIKLNL